MPDIFDIVDELRMVQCHKSIKGRIETTSRRSFDEVTPMIQDSVEFVLVLDKLRSVGEYILLNVLCAEHVDSIWEYLFDCIHQH